MNKKIWYDLHNPPPGACGKSGSDSFGRTGSITIDCDVDQAAFNNYRHPLQGDSGKLKLVELPGTTVDDQVSLAMRKLLSMPNGRYILSI